MLSSRSKFIHRFIDFCVASKPDCYSYKQQNFKTHLDVIYCCRESWVTLIARTDFQPTQSAYMTFLTPPPY